MNKALVVYFSISGTTAATAQKIAKLTGADTFELQAQEPYSTEDLDYANEESRVSKEMNDDTCRPAFVGEAPDLSDYDTIFVGYPIWWGRHPRIVDTFLEAENFEGKTLVPFAASGASGFDYAQKHIEAAATTARVLKGDNLTNETEANIKKWLDGLDL